MSRRKQDNACLARLFADFWVFEHWLNSGHCTIHTINFSGNGFRVAKIVYPDTSVAICIYASQRVANAVRMRIQVYYNQYAPDTTPNFVTMREFNRLWKEVSA